MFTFRTDSLLLQKHREWWKRFLVIMYTDIYDIHHVNDSWSSCIQTVFASTGTWEIAIIDYSSDTLRSSFPHEIAWVLPFVSAREIQTERNCEKLRACMPVRAISPVDVGVFGHKFPSSNPNRRVYTFWRCLFQSSSRTIFCVFVRLFSPTTVELFPLTILCVFMQLSCATILCVLIRLFSFTILFVFVELSCLKIWGVLVRFSEPSWVCLSNRLL